MKNREYYTYFVGAVPAGAIHNVDCENIIELALEADTGSVKFNTLLEISLMGVVSHTEAFFKNHFASIINIQPRLLEKLNHPDITYTASEVHELMNCSNQQFGGFISEKIDFGSAKKINSIYYKLLDITLFSKKEIEKYSLIQKDRNLLVHHGGIFTRKYLAQKGNINLDDAHMYSLRVDVELLLENYGFLKTIVDKTCLVTKNKLEAEINSFEDEYESKLEAAACLVWGLENIDDESK